MMPYKLSARNGLVVIRSGMWPIAICIAWAAVACCGFAWAYKMLTPTLVECCMGGLVVAFMMAGTFSRLEINKLQGHARLFTRRVWVFRFIKDYPMASIRIATQPIIYPHAIHSVYRLSIICGRQMIAIDEYAREATAKSRAAYLSTLIPVDSIAMPEIFVWYISAVFREY